MKTAIDEPLTKAVRNFLKGMTNLTMYHTLVPDELALQFIDRHADLLRQWNIVKLTRIFALEIRAAQPPKADPYQGFLFGCSWSSRLPLKKGGSTRLSRATVPILRESLSVMREAEHKKAVPPPNPKIEAVSQLIEEMIPFGRGITVERYCELKAAGVRPKEPTKKKGKAAGK